LSRLDLPAAFTGDYSCSGKGTGFNFPGRSSSARRNSE